MQRDNFQSGKLRSTLSGAGMMLGAIAIVAIPF